MRITRINHVAINAHGVAEEAHRFYTELLGLKQIPIQLPGRPAIKSLGGGFWLEQNSVQQHIIALEAKGEPPTPTGPHVSWYVADLEEAIADLEAEGLSPVSMGEGVNRIIWVADPAGNTVEFQQDPEI
jgi:catechol 2,3-dioxygenase-like lactoylglutathione lyase family enzyme